MAKTRHTNTSPIPQNKKKAKEKDPREDNDAIAPIQHICRTCLEEIQASSLIPLNDSSSNIRNELRSCIPEVDFDLVPNAGMCMYCLNALHFAYEFKQKCLQTEDKIRKQLHRKLLVDLTKLKKTNNIVEVSDGDGFGLDVVYINDADEVQEGEVEDVTPFANSPKAQMSTPLLDEEIEMINSSVNIQHDDEMGVNSISVEEIIPNRYVCSDDEAMDDSIQIMSESDGQKEESNLLLGVRKNVRRKASSKNAINNKKKIMDFKRPKEAKTELSKSMVRSILTKGMFLCLMCDKTFKKNSEYVRHVKQHTPQMFKCNGCDFKSNYLGRFLRHISLCKKSLAFKLKAAPQKTTKKASIQDDLVFKCANCKFTTSMRAAYNKHTQTCLNVFLPIQAKQKQTSKIAKRPKPNMIVKLKAKDKLNKIKNDSTSSPKIEVVNAAMIDLFGDLNKHTCPYCDYTVEDNFNEFEAHVTAVHQSEFPYACRDKKCHFFARAKQGLIAHMTYHYGDRPYRCTTCTYQCLSKGSLHNHTNKHARYTTTTGKKTPF